MSRRHPPKVLLATLVLGSVALLVFCAQLKSLPLACAWAAAMASAILFERSAVNGRNGSIGRQVAQLIALSLGVALVVTLLIDGMGPDDSRSVPAPNRGQGQDESQLFCIGTCP
jgi:hypothetical protein